MQWSNPQNKLIGFAGDDSPVIYADGSTQSGKTYAMCHAFVLYIAANLWPIWGFDGFAIMAPRSTQIRALLISLEEAARSIGYPCRIYGDGHAKLGRHHINGCVIKNKDSRASFHGGRYGAVMIDEVTLCDSETVQYAEGRISRPPKNATIGKLFTATNPDNPQHWWKTDRIDKNPDAHIKFIIDDNPSLTQEYKDYLKSSWTGSMLQRMYYGEWIGHVGLVYPLFWECVRDGPTAEPVAYDLTIDHATSGVTHAIVHAVYPNGHRRAVDEWRYEGAKQDLMSTSQQCYTMKTAFDKYLMFRNIYVDPAAAHMMVDVDRIIGKVSVTYNNVLLGIQQCMMYMNAGMYTVDKDACPETARETNGYSWDSRAADRGEPDTVLKINDHAPDAIRYYLYSEAQRQDLRISKIVH